MRNTKISDGDKVYYSLPRHNLIKMAGVPLGRVLEIGCGAGVTLAIAKQCGASYVCGVEISPAAAKEARQHPDIDAVFEGSIETDNFPPISEPFDLIIASHVLEHLVDPWVATRKLYQLLKPGGIFIGAIPNVRHASVVLPLLTRGHWEYQPSGIMDWSHLRFFSKHGIRKLLLDSGFRDIRMQPDILGPKSKLIQRVSIGILTDFAAYAYNFRAVRPN